MSLIQSIKSRSHTDIINEGSRVSLTGTFTSGSDQIILSPGDNQFLIITGFCLSTNASSAILVSLGFRNEGLTTDIFSAYISDGAFLCREYSFGSWIYGDLSYDLVLTVPSDTVAYTIDGKISSSPTPLGYIQQIGTQDHANPYFGLESGLDRGQSEF